MSWLSSIVHSHPTDLQRISRSPVSPRDENYNGYLQLLARESQVPVRQKKNGYVQMTSEYRKLRICRNRINRIRPSSYLVFLSLSAFSPMSYFALGYDLSEVYRI